MGILAIPLPERQGHRMALGPFSGNRQLLRTLLGATTGALIALAVSPLAGLVLAALAVVMTLVQVDGESLWDVSLDALRFQLRRIGATRGPGGAGLALQVRGDLLHDAEGGMWAAWELSPRPVFGRDPTELLEESRALLRLLPATTGEVFLVRVSEPWPRPPQDPPPAPKEQAVQRAYRDLQDELRRGRYRSRLFLLLPARVLVEPTAGPGAGPLHPPPSWSRVRGRELQRFTSTVAGPV